MSPRRFDGWEPQEVHEHFRVDDETGDHVRCRAADAHYTVVTREPEWDDESRGRALRLAEYERGLCPCGCGLPASDAHDPSKPMVVRSYTCMAARAVAIKRRKERDAHKDAKPNRDGSHWDDGLNFYAVPYED